MKKISPSRRSGQRLMLLYMQYSGITITGRNKRIRSLWEDSLGYGISPPLPGILPGVRSIQTLTRAYPDILEEELEKNGVTVLRNEWTELEISGQSVIICGVDDIWAGRANPPDDPG